MRRQGAAYAVTTGGAVGRQAVDHQVLDAPGNCGGGQGGVYRAQGVGHGGLRVETDGGESEQTRGVHDGLTRCRAGHQAAGGVYSQYL